MVKESRYETVFMVYMRRTCQLGVAHAGDDEKHATWILNTTRRSATITAAENRPKRSTEMIDANYPSLTTTQHHNLAR